jgi:hypothetical protein
MCVVNDVNYQYVNQYVVYCSCIEIIVDIR